MEKYGFVYIWYDSYKKMFYIGSHWGTEDDGYISSSRWMKDAYKKRPWCFKRRILMRIYSSRKNLLAEEQYWLNMIKPEELASIRKSRYDKVKVRYYNLKLEANGGNGAPEGVGLAISAAKKGKALTEAHKAALTGIKKPSHTDEWKAENSRRMKEQWNDGTRKRAEPKQTMSLEEQGALSSSRLKQLWADPVWAEKQRQRLAEGAKSRPPRSEESKYKARIAQLGKSKQRRNNV